jgi:hypothetical protein
MNKRDDAAPTRESLTLDEAPRWTSPAPNGRVIAVVLQQLADDCAHDDARMMKGPWAYDDTEAEIRGGVGRTGDLVASGGSVGYENARMSIEAHDGEAIASSRNRLSDLVRVLREAAKCLDSLEELRRDHVHLRRQYAESRDYVATLVREASDLGASAQRHVDEANKADARITELEGAFAEALTIAEWESSEYQGKPEHLTRLPELRAVLARKDPA